MSILSYLSKRVKTGRGVDINDHFLDYIENWDHYEYFLLGGYGSSKSFNTAVKLIRKARKDKRIFLVVREVFNTHRESTYEDLKDAIQFLGHDAEFKYTTNPLSIRCLKTGSRFIFRGLDNWRKLKSIRNVSCVWLEEGEGSFEAYKELKDRMRMRGKRPHIIVTTNPHPKRHWTYKRFITELGVDEYDFYNKKQMVVGDVYLHHSDYRDNKFLNPQWVKNLLAETDPILKRIKQYGHFGSDGTRVLHNIVKGKHGDIMRIVDNLPESQKYNGLDWGFEKSYNAFVRCAVDKKNNILYVYSEYYKRGMIDADVMRELNWVKEQRLSITADSEDPKSISTWRRAGFKIFKCKKYKGSVLQNIRKLRGFSKIVISDLCPNVWDELEELSYEVDKYGEIIEDKFNIDAHTKDALVYALDKFEHIDLKNRYDRLDNYTY